MPKDTHSSNFSSSLSQPGLALPSQSVQNHIHELAKTLPPPRKQNTACDACRSRKVKCNRVQGQEKVQYIAIPHCLSKNYPCTSVSSSRAHYVQQATSERKRVGVPRRPRNTSTSSSASPIIENGYPAAFPKFPTFHTGPIPIKFGFYPPITLDTPTREVLLYLFSPPEIASDHTPFGQTIVKSPYADWGEQAIKLENEAFRTEFALDLVEVFFQIVHSRLPLLNPALFRERLNLHDASGARASEKPLHPALVATVLAWGAKFSEHPLLVADRQRPSGQSHLARILIDRAREFAEALKVHRVPHADHVVIGLLIEPLQSQNPEDANGYHGFWLTAATRHLLDLQINHKSVMSTIQDPEARGTMIFAWWMACICDAYASAYYRRKPVLDDDDYDIDFYTADPVHLEAAEPHSPLPSPREQLEFLGYYRAAHALARISRQMSRQLWRPVTEADGIPLSELSRFSHSLVEWRDAYLNSVGVPSNFEGEWDFVSAVSSCASDATFHVMWIILFSALDEFGIREVNELQRAGSPAAVLPNEADVESVKRKVMDEALHGALRIAGLAGVLTSNGYLRLDPAVMHVSCIHAGTLLARLGRPEVSNCIAGLEQYSHSYEEAGEQASELKRMYKDATSGHSDLAHMHSTVQRGLAVDPTANHSMAIDTLHGSSFAPAPFGR
ncbi:hypothetical protein EYR36_004985 [Pleurotus pulmonarius]|nr:hypothetical protein EYR36_004985 [Pleurotus pulmonarius]KAF4589974.1 hypothetical protein EYR38_009270 [Pleurotus pulmonarius]